jgi:hypothetical protein
MDNTARRSSTFGICLTRQSAKTVIFLLSLVFQYRVLLRQSPFGVLIASLVSLKSVI